MVWHIVGAGNFRADTFLPAAEDKIIAVDGGIAHCGRYDAAVGDFDSLGYVPEGDRVFRHPAKKDDTDMMLAVKMALEAGAKTLYLHGGTGGRADHTMANYEALAYIARKGAIGFLIGEEGCATCIANGAIRFGREHSGYISVFSWSETALGVSIRGLAYEVEGLQMFQHIPRGVSNEFIGREAEISVSQGMLLILWQDPIWPLPTLADE